LPYNIGYMERNIYVVMMAGGSGLRMGADKPKQFLRLGNKPILQCTIEKFINACPGIKVVTVLPKDYLLAWRDYCSSSGFFYPQALVEGGITRFHSVKNALAKVPDGAIVAIHDGVRPLLSESLIKNLLAMMKTAHAVIPIVPCIDTLKSIEQISSADGTSKFKAIEGKESDRSKIFCAQTPQIFLSEEIKDAYTAAYDLSFTDDASVAENKKIPLTYVLGERYNLKITTPEDLDIARAFVSLKKK
jgi:2-C-methyl-D-erythritol 4-phosphate cytidylyltransferase